MLIFAGDHINWNRVEPVSSWQGPAKRMEGLMGKLPLQWRDHVNFSILVMGVLQPITVCWPVSVKM